MRFLRNSVLTLPVLLALFSFCAYYNTFYNAEKKFKEAQKIHKRTGLDEPNRTANPVYDDAIKKASKVLTFHSKSKWVDDALLLIGKSFYYKGEYNKAERKFQELLANFPKSDFTQDCHYFIALCQYKMNSIPEAISALNSILKKEKKDRFKPDAAHLLAEIYFEQQEYDQAIEKYTSLLKDYRKAELEGKAQFRIGECYFLKGDYQKAYEAFAQVQNFSQDRTMIFESQFKVGECLYLLNRIDDGMEVFQELSQDDQYFKYFSRIELEIADGHLLKDSLDLALKEYEHITVTYPKSEQAAQAYYEMGLINQDRLLDLKKAKELFDKAHQEKPQSEIAKKALEKSANLAKLEEYQKQLTEAEKPEVTLYLLAEAYLFEMHQPDSAIAEFSILAQDYPESEFAPRSLYAIAWIKENIKKDAAGAEEFYKKLLDGYPTSDYSDLARSALGIATDSLSPLAPKNLFQEAEKLLMEEGNIDSARSLYQRIVDDFPNSRFAPAALYGLVWTREQYDNPGDSTVILAYQELVEKYPDSEYADAARTKLGIKKVTKAVAQPQEPAPAAQEEADTLAQQQAPPQPEFPLAPRPKIRGQFVYPESELESGIKGKAVFKIMIDNFSGEVLEAEIVNSLGNHYIDQAAKEAVMMTVFEPDSIDIMHVGGYFLFEVPVNPPAQDDRLLDKTGGEQH